MSQAGMPNTTKEHFMQLTAPLKRLQPVVEVPIMMVTAHRAHALGFLLLTGRCICCARRTRSGRWTTISSRRS